MVKGVLFDFNGVLLLDTKWHEEAWNDLSVYLRDKPITPEESEKYIHGRTPHDTLVFLLGKEPDKLESKRLLDRKETLYQKVCLRHADEFKLNDGAQELFTLLESKGIKKTIATSSPLVNLKFYYEHLNLEKWFPFENTIYADGSFPGKPAPDIFLKAADVLGLNPSECMVIEDASSGIAAAKAANVGKTILLVTNDNKNTASKVEVDKVVTNLSQIVEEDFI